ncbi:DUF4012 domain-containing protein [Candidatus Microgenomates bacterium]|nr:DUF4012 domain-containing protein [Candidatus Microgenomates bacterium]
MIRGLGTLLAEKTHPVVWVTGAAGCLGSFLCEELLKRGSRVIAIDTWHTGIASNLSHLLSHKNFQLVEKEVNKSLNTQLLRPQYIFHLEKTATETPDAFLVSSREFVRSTEELLEEAGSRDARFLLVFTPGERNTPKASASHFAQTLVSEFTNTRKINGRVVLLGNLYGPRMPMGEEDPLAHVFRGVLYKQSLSVPDKRIAPLFVHDAVAGVLTAMFGTGTRGKVCSFAVQELPLSHFAQLVEKVSTSEHFPFFSELSPSLTTRDGVHDTLLLAPTPLSVGIRETLAFFRQHLSRVKTVQSKSRAHESPKERKPRHSISTRTKLIVIGSVFLLIMWVVGLPFLSFGAGIAALGLTRQALNRGSFENARSFSSFAKTSLVFADRGFAKFEFLPLVDSAVSGLRRQVQGTVRLARVSNDVAETGVLGKKVIAGILIPSVPTSETDIARLGLEVEQLAQEVGFLQTEKIPSIVSAQAADFVSDMEEGYVVLTGLSRVVRAGQDLLGYRGKRTYLVLFQNNMELRPTGGFIGSFGLLSFERGKLTNIEIQDVYAADGQLTGHVEPPEKLKEHLGEAGWYLRDSNWDPDFPTSAARAEWFLDKELNVKVDGVIAVDLEFVKQLISVVGSLSLADFGTEVVETNFYEKTQNAAHEGFFPGSTQKKDFLAAVARALAAQLQKSPQNALSIGRAFYSSLFNGHIIVALHKKEAQAAVAQLGWDGAVKQVDCPPTSPQCVADYLFPVEANVGVNKANYHLSRSFLLDISRTQEQFLHELTISYVNKSPRGDATLRYKNYLRLYLPSSSTIISASLVNPVSGERVELTIDEGEEYGKKVGGMLIEIPAGETRQVVVSWNGAQISVGTPVSFLWQKQPGTGEDPVTLRIRNADARSIRLTPSPSLTQQNVLGYNTVLRGDLQFSATWLK